MKKSRFKPQILFSLITVIVSSIGLLNSLFQEEIRLSPGEIINTSKGSAILAILFVFILSVIFLVYGLLKAMAETK